MRSPEGRMSFGRQEVVSNESFSFWLDLISITSFEQPGSMMSERQKGFKNQMKMLKQSSLEQNVAEEELMYLESDWSVIVKNQNELNKKMHNQQVRFW